MASFAECKIGIEKNCVYITCIYGNHFHHQCINLKPSEYKLIFYMCVKSKTVSNTKTMLLIIQHY